jgi:threonine dehydrogenase-like Zn-dependent dehydrogenase
MIKVDTMYALRFSDGSLNLASVAVPQPEDFSAEALVRVRLAGICQTDLELTRGYMAFDGTLGHEFVGEIVQGNAEWPVGTRVCGDINVACGQCDYCLAEIPSHCRNRRVLGILNYDGTFADFVKLPFANLHRVPDSVPDRHAVFTEPLAAALQLTRTSPVSPADRVVLIGAGKLGLLIAQVLKLTGCDLTVIARRERPIGLLRRWGIPTVTSAEMLPQRQAHMVVEVTGNEEGFAAALDLVRPGGTIALKSTFAGIPHANLSRVVVDEIRVVGSRCGPFDAALRLMEAGLVDLDGMIEETYPLSDSLAAFAHAAQPGILKVLLQP